MTNCGSYCEKIPCVPENWPKSLGPEKGLYEKLWNVCNRALYAEKERGNSSWH